MVERRHVFCAQLCSLRSSGGRLPEPSSEASGTMRDGLVETESSSIVDDQNIAYRYPLVI